MFTFLPEPETNDPRGFDKEPTYLVRLGSLSSTLRRRAYTRAVATIRDGKQRSLEFISELNSTVDQVGLGSSELRGGPDKESQCCFS